MAAYQPFNVATHIGIYTIGIWVALFSVYVGSDTISDTHGVLTSRILNPTAYRLYYHRPHRHMQLQAHVGNADRWGAKAYFRLATTQLGAYLQ